MGGSSQIPVRVWTTPEDGHLVLAPSIAAKGVTRRHPEGVIRWMRSLRKKEIVPAVEVGDETLEQPQFLGAPQRLGAAVGTELAIDPPDVRAHRVHRDLQLTRDLGT